MSEEMNKKLGETISVMDANKERGESELPMVNERDDTLAAKASWKWTLTLRWTLTLYPLFAKPPTMMVSPLRSAATWLWFLTGKHWDKRSLATGQSLSTARYAVLL